MVAVEPHNIQKINILVENSLHGRAWSLHAGFERHAMAISQAYDLSEVVGSILASRNIELDDVPNFLEPSLRASLPDPSRLNDMDKATTHLCDAIENNKKIAVFGDYDVDGATSSALLVRYFKAIGVDISCYIPDRMSEGYGPNEAALLKLKESGVETVITVDCGTLSYQPLAAAKKAGLDIIVLDHHKAETTLPQALAIINPNRLDEGDDVVKDMGHMAAVGVTFLLLVSLNRALREANKFDSRPEPDLTHLLDLVALGTVCDVVSLTGVNRALVAQGLKIMAGRRNVGLRALSDVARVDTAPNAYHAGFLLGPRVNAGGRVGEAGLGARLLSLGDGDGAEATEIAQKLDGLNQDRRTIEAKVLEEASLMVEAEFGLKGVGDIVFVAGKGWHAGVIGIVASRLKERYNRPTFVLAIDGDEAKCSARSIAGVDIGTAVIEAMHKGLLLAGGGHAMAAGLTVATDGLDKLRVFLDEQLGNNVKNAIEGASLHLDGHLSVGGANEKLVNELERLAPFGSGNPRPRFALMDATIVNARIVGENHLKLVIKGDDAMSIEAIAFRALDEEWGQILLNGVGQKFHFAGKLKLNEWRGKSKVELTLEDAVKL